MAWRRAMAVSAVLIGTEIVHGVIRTLLLAPRVGDRRARQIGLFMGSLLNLRIVCLASRWIGAQTARSLTAIGIVRVMLTMLFEVSFGRFVIRASWQQIRSDYALRDGGWPPIGPAALATSSLIAARLRRALCQPFTLFEED